MFGELGETATISGQAGVNVICSDVNQNHSTDDMGVMPEANLEVRVRPSTLNATPQLFDTVTIRNKTYRISNIDESADENELILYLIDDAQ